MELNIQFLLLQKKNKQALKNYKKLWEETKRQIEVINDDEPIEYRKDFLKMKFESDDDLPLIVCLYSKNVSFYVFITNKLFNFLRNTFNNEAIEINNFTSVTK